ncbi:hypothetical protein EUTSA_v10007180mg [Eutrema salsugineum]|uniref:Glyoxysomal processing protease, glyoxysomal n=1 Tax=Eutrema salsugineum TaxID=72664 RepID=V4K8T9_EUTSA|nr:hypothetical protein EUTSA_v10007180mg [Eutrema salsugineum]
MDLSKVINFSRKFAVLVKDPKGLKMRKHAFHQYHSGNTTLSASGILLPKNMLNGKVAASKLMSEAGQDMSLVLTVASLVEPFLTLGHRASISQDPVKLISGARIEIMVEGQLNSVKEDPFWVPAQLLSMIDVLVSSATLQSLIEASLGSKDFGWDVGWSLVSAGNGSQHSSNMMRVSNPLMQLDESHDAKFMAKSATQMALLGVSLNLLVTISLFFLLIMEIMMIYNRLKCRNTSLAIIHLLKKCTAVNNGVWASSVILNEHGLILTNAHLLEPWRFGKGGVYVSKEFSSTRSRFWEQKSQTLPQKTPSELYPFVGKNVKKCKHNFFQTGNRDIHVRLYHQDSWIWCPAKVVYVCKEQLDVALLHLEHVPGNLQPIRANFSSPALGTSAHVVGHGLFGPRCGLSPSICFGFVAKVVHAKMRLYTQSTSQKATEFPTMIETTAAVHPGGSGGVVVNSSGHMIGLVTSNARHGAGTVIPHLNFSIPCAILAPIFKFAEDMQNMEILQTLDQPNEKLSSIWALMPSLSPKPNPKTDHSLPNLPKLLKDGNNKQKKGSQFAKFIAETQNMFIKPTKLSRDVIPSKL